MFAVVNYNQHSIKYLDNSKLTLLVDVSPANPFYIIINSTFQGWGIFIIIFNIILKNNMECMQLKIKKNIKETKLLLKVWEDSYY